MKVCVPSKPQKNQADDVLCMKRPSRMIEKIENLSSLDNSVRRLFLTRPNGIIDGNVAKKLNAFPILERLDILNAMVELTFLVVLLPNIRITFTECTMLLNDARRIDDIDPKTSRLTIVEADVPLDKYFAFKLKRITNLKRLKVLNCKLKLSFFESLPTHIAVDFCDCNLTDHISVSVE
ncbi:uncharacterized protein LOC117103527 [Anneissia japonica]|uniref:uncharacterized protein LOC117103527 n=1 Tax=Anneissia japonica TaxID=1529436 RepID=UPI0014259B68|nr:uncharacterized protein LOC117103527 [Anneissia japonica]